MKDFSIIVFLLICFCSLKSEDKPVPSEHFTREKTYHVVHYKLRIELDEKAKSCEGDVGIKLVPLRPQFDLVQLDAAQMTITQVRLGALQLRYHQSGDSLLVDLDKVYGMNDTLNLTVAYTLSAPNKGLYFIEPDSGYLKQQRLVWSNGEAEENHYWFPCYDFPNDMSTSELTATVNDKWVVISNGKLLDVKRDQKHHKATFHWYESKPHVSYLISLVAGEYAEVKDSAGSVPLSYYVYKHQREDAWWSFNKTPKIMNFYASKIGYPYPWEKYAQTVVQDYIWGGEENVSATTLTDGTMHDARSHLDYSSDDLVAHELAHQWWGDLLTCRDWSHTWLNEGFATYFTVAFQEFDKGRDVADKSILDAQQDIVNRDFGDNRKPTVNSRFVYPNEVFTNRIYGKGACVLNMMRHILGEELFWKAINHYVHKFAFKNVETNDFKVAIEEATGYNLYWFFDEWLYKAGYPELDVRTNWSQSKRSMNITVRQIQKTDWLTPVFRMPLDIEVWVNGVPETYHVTVARDSEEYAFPAYQQPQLVIFDRGSVILKKVHEHKSTDEWIFQLQHARDGVDRYLAASELYWISDSNIVTVALSKALMDDPFWEVRREAAFALGDARKANAGIGDSLIEAYGDRDARVRAAVVTALQKYKGERVLNLLKHAFEKDSSYAVSAAALTSMTFVDSINMRNYCKAGLERDSYKEQIRLAAIHALAREGDDTAMAIIKEWTKYGVDRNLRTESLWTLSRTWKTNEHVFDYFVSMLNDPSLRVRRSVASILGTLDNTKAIEPLTRTAATATDSSFVKTARESITKIQEAQHSHEGK